ncbi:hypothetical protein C8A00DRAFT_40616 [Chaetomidium leptoderma]|uniref:Uncharacterized protein n=1 Tax=Chaetomidium leptoderma TaxID=669021 RepID=A0AAN6VTD3_9PEZI|nr:hypothetical protein C8A00DRAFT_40616 [Chaetomidium leptoderma]
MARHLSSRRFSSLCSMLPTTSKPGNPIIWNGQVYSHSCLLDRPFDGDDVCGDPLPADLGTLSPTGGELVQGNGDGSDYPSGQGPAGPIITYRSGTPSPTCTTKCGTLCTGYYCEPNPTGEPPDFTDPVNGGECAFKTTTTQCNGSGGHTVCVPVEVCTKPTDMPTLTSKPDAASPTGSCLASGPVSTCAMGPGGQRACITSTTCTEWARASPTTNTPPPNPPSPTPHNAFVAIALDELFMTSDIGGDWSREWDVFSAPLSGVIRLCDDHPIFSQSTTATGMSPGFPPTLGPFTAQGFTCTYRGTRDKLGLLECDGVQNMWCEKVQGNAVEACSLFDNPIMVPVVVCRW